MVSVAAAVRSILAEDPLLRYSLASGLMNVRAVARAIRPRVAARAGAPVNDVAAVVNAVLRFRDHPDTRAQLDQVKSGAANARIEAASGLVRTEHIVAEGLLRSLGSLRARAGQGTAFHMATSGDRVAVVADRRALEGLKKLGPQDIAEGSAVVEVRMDEGTLPASFPPTVLALLAQEGITVPCWACTPRGLWVCVDEDALARAVAVVRSLA